MFQKKIKFHEGFIINSTWTKSLEENTYPFHNSFIGFNWDNIDVVNSQSSSFYLLISSPSWDTWNLKNLN